MFCSRCGRQVADDSYFCPACGYVLGAGQQQVMYERREEKNGMAVAGFICAFISPLFGWIFGGIGLGRAAKRNGKGRGLSIAALIVSTVTFVISYAILMSMY